MRTDAIAPLRSHLNILPWSFHESWREKEAKLAARRKQDGWRLLGLRSWVELHYTVIPWGPSLRGTISVTLPHPGEGTRLELGLEAAAPIEFPMCQGGNQAGPLGSCSFFPQHSPNPTNLWVAWIPKEKAGPGSPLVQADERDIWYFLLHLEDEGMCFRKCSCLPPSNVF